MTGRMKPQPMMQERNRSIAAITSGLLLAACTLFVAGCGGAADAPDLGQVVGTVTLDGQPLPGAIIQFSPQEGRPSTATTDEAGYYELKYSQDEAGAKVGPHTVSISTFSYSTPDVPEKLPARYNAQTTLTATVEAGENTIPFDLQSK